MQSTESTTRGFRAATGDTTGLFWTLFDNIQFGLMTFDCDLRLCAANSRAVDLLQVSHEKLAELAGPNELFRFLIERQYLGGSAGEDLISGRMNKLRSQEIHEFELKGSDGKLLHIRELPEPSGGFVSIVTDITHASRQTADDKLANIILNNLPHPAYAIDRKGKFEFANAAFLKAHNATLEDVIGKRRKDFLPATGNEDHSSGATREEVRIRYPDGSSIDAVIDEILASDTEDQNFTIGQITDISENKLRERQLNAVLSNIDFGVLFMDANLNKQILNDRAVEMWGLNPEDVEGVKSLRDMLTSLRDRGVFVLDDESDAAWEEFVSKREDVARAGELTGQEYPLVDGRTFLYSAYQVGDGRMLTYYDITNLKAQENHLRDALKQAQLSAKALNEIGTPVSIKNEDLQFVFVNEAYCEKLGYDKHSTVGKSIHDVQPLDVARNVEQFDRELLANNTSVTFEEKIRVPDGSYIHAQTHKGILQTDDGERFVLAAFSDVTRLKKNEADLRKALEISELSQQVLDQLTSPLVVKNKDLEYVMANEAYCRLIGVPKEDLYGKRASEIHPANLSQWFDRNDRKVIEMGESLEYMEQVPQLDGTEATSITRKKLVVTTNNERYSVTTVNDVTNLQQALTQAELSEQVLDRMQNPVSVKDRDLRFLVVNTAMAHLLNADKRDIIGKSAADFPERLDVANITEAELSVLNTGQSVTYETEHHMANGDVMAILVNKTPVVLNDEPDHVITVINDVTSIKEREQQYKKALEKAELSQMVLDQVPVPVMAKDASRRYVLTNAAFCETYGIRKEDALGRTAEECFDSHTSQHFKDHDEKVLKTGELVQWEDRFFRQDGTEITGILRKTAAQIDSGEHYIIGVVSDVSELKKREKLLVEARRDVEEQNAELERTKRRAEFDSLHDSLTNLPNRRYLDRKLQAWANAGQEERIALLQIDLDRFKEINDTLGHAAGDFVLQHVAYVLRSHTAEDDFIARIGGDEFVILRYGQPPRAELEQLAAELIAELNKPVSFHGDVCRTGASIGIDIGVSGAGEKRTSNEAASDGTTRESSRLLMNADLALYRAKRSGRSRFSFFSKNLQKDIERTKRISDDILEALDKGEFYPVYQPQFDAQSLELIGVEALARWRHPQLGDLAPPAFLEAAKELGAADSIDQAILETSLIDLEDWEASGVPIGRLAVNVSAQRIGNPLLIDLLKKLQVPRGRLSFEIQEATLLDHTNEELRQRIKDICNLGIDIEIDNFGSGQASFLGMWSAAPKRVKIDRDLVRPIVSSPEHERLLEAIIGMARSINLEVACEGVETHQHIKILQKLGCNVLQGYALAKPMPAHEIPHFSHLNQRFSLGS